MSFLSTSPGDSNNLGYFATSAALIAAYPVGVPGVFAIVGATDTVWIWDEGTNVWVNSGGGGGGGPIIGTSAPAITPTVVGGLFIDTLNGNVYVAVGTNSSGDWVQVNGSGGAAALSVEIPIGAIDGVNQTFTVFGEPAWIVVNGVTYWAGYGYTYASNVITLSFAPDTGSWIRAVPITPPVNLNALIGLEDGDSLIFENGIDAIYE